MTTRNTPPTSPATGRHTAPRFTPAPPISLGLRRYSPHTQAEGRWLGGPDPLGITGLAARQMTEKNRLLDTRRQAVFDLQKQAEAAAIEAATLIKDITAIPQVRSVPRRSRRRMRVRRNGVARNLLLSLRLPTLLIPSRRRGFLARRCLAASSWCPADAKAVRRQSRSHVPRAMQCPDRK